ncbi:MAG TPA: hypothetical protein VFG04_30205 [Planctomycetaceae bacterium]|jgi:hypothetical protein|nr:hypothetical protein [Planctomycetaceae bacterium]
MSASQPPRHILRRLGALLGGMVAIVVLSIGTDVALQVAGVFPDLIKPGLFSSPLLLLATAYRSVYNLVGGYLTARWAPDRPMAHALVLGAIGVVLSIAGAVTMWNVGPNWYPLALVVLAMPCAWAGGKLYVTRLHA